MRYIDTESGHGHQKSILGEEWREPAFSLRSANTSQSDFGNAFVRSSVYTRFFGFQGGSFGDIQ